MPNSLFKRLLHIRIILIVTLGLATVAGGPTAWAHDVPDRFFDRSIQVSINPDRIRVSYQLSLTQLTLAEELLSLVGPGGLSGTGPTDRLGRYAEEMGPLLARGVLIKVDGAELATRFVRASHRIEDHPRFEFEIEANLDRELGGQPSLTIEDTNFFLEKGRIRIAVRAET